MEDRRLFAVGSPSLVLDINPGSGSGLVSQTTPQGSARLGDVLLFSANDGTTGTEVWRSDGTAAGTYRVVDINPGLAGSPPASFVTLNGVAYFTANRASDGRELWRSDGTEAGTYVVKDLYPGATSSAPVSLIAANNALFFIANDGVTGSELYKSDGTAAGTGRLTDVTPDGSTSRLLTSLVASGGNVYFIANDTGSGNRLWKYDGTSASAVYELSSGISNPSQMFNFNGTLVFSAFGSSVGQQLFRSDGTAAGTYHISTTITPTPGGQNFSGMTVLGDTLYFSALTANGSELWKTNGTLAGTQQVTDFLGQGPTSLKVFKGKLFFTASIDTTAGAELFVSDGTSAGTQLFKDLNPGSGSSQPTQMTVTPDGRMYFLATDPNGQEMWVTDGTVAGTYRVSNIGPTSKSALIATLGTLGNAVLFSANDAAQGNELWHLEAPLPPGPNQPPTAVITAPTSANEGTTVNLSGANSTDDMAIYRYEWDFNYNGFNFDVDAVGINTSFAVTDGNGPRTIALRVVDSDNVTSATVTATINTINLPPTAASISYSSSVFEGSSGGSLTVNGVTDPGTGDLAAGLTYSYDFDGDGTFELANVSYTNPLTPESIYADGNKTFNMVVRIKDKDGGYTDYTLPVSVVNSAPRATLARSGAANEGSAITLSFTNATDDSAADRAAGFKYSFDFDNDGVYEIVDSSSASAQYTWADNGSKTWRGRITDKDGGLSVYTQTFTVANVAPTATFASGGSIVEGSSATVSFTNQADASTIDAAAGYSYSYDLNNDGVYEISNVATASASGVFADNGTYTVRGIIRDKDGGQQIYTTTVTVTNAPPSAHINAPATGVEGNQVQLTALVSDLGVNDTFTYAWSATKNGAAYATGTATTFSFTPNDQGSYVVSLTVTDDDGGSFTAFPRTINVSNRAPTAVFAATGVINEGSAGTFSFTGMSDAAADLSGLRYSFDFNNDGDFADAGEIANGTSASRSFTWTDNGTRTIRGRITDKDGAFTDYTTTVTVNNVAPTATITGPTSGKKNKAITFTLTATDPSTADAAGNFTFRIDWDGNGTIDQTVTGRSGMTVSRKYTTAGTFNVRVTATDKDGGLSLLSPALVVKIT